ncbi:MAG TPA: hypothetical protein VNE21_03880, partial [Mycobacteriales bacterium]|nr:hypothetical protein [Mycobacteriales bacterium]
MSVAVFWATPPTMTVPPGCGAFGDSAVSVSRTGRVNGLGAALLEGADPFPGPVVPCAAVGGSGAPLGEPAVGGAVVALGPAPSGGLVAEWLALTGLALTGLALTGREVLDGDGDGVVAAKAMGPARPAKAPGATPAPSTAAAARSTRNRRVTRGPPAACTDRRRRRTLSRGAVPCRVVPTAPDPWTSAQITAVKELARVTPVADELAVRFAAAGHELHLVGGSVRDALLGRLGNDLDLATDARPERVLELAGGWADAVWEVGVAFGTVGLSRHGRRLEVTTFRADRYEPASRKPEVAFGDSLVGDLRRRDFTVNAMAVALPFSPAQPLTDPFAGQRDLADRVLRTPGRPEESFDDDPLRML